MFDRRHHEIGMELTARLGVPADRLSWLADRLPLSGDNG
jgi:hypothetical protein